MSSRVSSHKRARLKKRLPDLIAVTGTPGTGKTTFSRSLAKRKGYLYFDVTSFIRKNRLHDSYDRRRKSLIVDAKKLTKAILSALQGLKKGVVIDSHLSHYLPARLVSRCIVTKCELRTLHRRLSRRGYGKAKIQENMQSEIFDICLVEASRLGHNVEIVWTDAAKPISGGRVRQRLRSGSKSYKYSLS